MKPRPRTVAPRAEALPAGRGVPRAPLGKLARLALAALLGACSRAPQAGTAAAPSPGPAAPLAVSFQLDWYPAAEHGGFFDAAAKGLYRKRGLDVTIRPGGPGAIPFQYLSVGRADFALGRSDDVILAARQGLPLLIVCAQMEHDPQAIMMHEGSPVRSFADLAGRSVMANPGANWIAYVQHRYRVAFSVIPLDYGIARFMADPDFIQQCFVSNEPYFAEQHGARVRTLLVASGGYDPYRVVVTNRGFAARHPEAVRAFVAATIEGYGLYLHGDAQPARDRIQRENPTQTPPLMDFSVAALKRYRLVEGDPGKGERTGLITPERMEAMQRTLVDLKLLDAPLPLEKFVSFAFLPTS